ncbi:Hypp5805 [Branchiostoma lanceolatum]|uniref:Hypp5805 protein n=1 Tax=Branchiostoma lanceolatum TaxID=7740 RepID=A0A8J9W4K8_BRALA|nr:Hypp5805 [Branchiostoma lanceolatum]
MTSECLELATCPCPCPTKVARPTRIYPVTGADATRLKPADSAPARETQYATHNTTHTAMSG